MGLTLTLMRTRRPFANSAANQVNESDPVKREIKEFFSQKFDAVSTLVSHKMTHRRSTLSSNWELRMMRSLQTGNCLLNTLS